MDSNPSGGDTTDSDGQSVALAGGWSTTEQIASKLTVGGESPVREEPFRATRLERARLEVVLQDLAVALARPGMVAIDVAPTVPHGEKDLGVTDGQRTDACPRLIVIEPHVLVLRERSERVLLPVLTRKEQRRAGRVVHDGSTDLPPGNVEEQEWHDEGNHRLANHAPPGPDGGDHRVQEARPVPVVIIHLLAQQTVRLGGTAVEFATDGCSRLDPEQTPTERLDGMRVRREAIAVVDHDELSPRIDLVPIARQGDTQKAGSIACRQDDRDEGRVSLVAANPPESSAHAPDPSDQRSR